MARGEQTRPTHREQRDILRTTKRLALEGEPAAVLALSNYRLADALERPGVAVYLPDNGRDDEPPRAA